MENNLEILNNIMKPYFDKKQEIDNKPINLENDRLAANEKIRQLKNERINKRKELEIELENLRVSANLTIKEFEEKKEIEIQEYISNAMDSNSNFFATYGSMLRKDLEAEYDKKLKDIENKFKEQEEKIISEINLLKSVSEEEKLDKQNLEDLSNKSDYSRVDLRELVEIKEDLRKKLIAEQKRLNFELRQEQLNFDSIMLSLSSINSSVAGNPGEEVRALFDQSHRITDKMTEIKKALKKVEEYLKTTELTEEERKAIMMSMTLWEKAEYDRRKNAKSIEIEGELETVSEIPEEIEEVDFSSDFSDEELEDISKEVFDISNEELESSSDFSDEELEDISKESFDISNEELEFSSEMSDEELEDISKKIFEKLGAQIESEENTSEVTKDIINDDIVEINDVVKSHYEDDGENIYVEDHSNLLKTIYNDVVKEAMNLRSIIINESKGDLGKDEYYIRTKENQEDYSGKGTIDLSDEDSLKLPIGEYINYEDITVALDNLYSKTKDRKYVVTESEKIYEISTKAVKKFKSQLKKCSTLKLVKEQKLSKFDLFKVFGKQKSEQIIKEVEIGEIKDSKVPEGEYINRNELILAMDKLFTTPKLSWLRSISDMLKQKSYNIDDEDRLEFEPVDPFEDEDIKIK